jgi:hypothetical protein
MAYARLIVNILFSNTHILLLDKNHGPAAAELNQTAAKKSQFLLAFSAKSL